MFYRRRYFRLSQIRVIVIIRQVRHFDCQWLAAACDIVTQAAALKIIGKGYNKRNQMGNPLAHAEIEAINQAAAYLGDWRLEECTLYVTLEPCPMCAGAIVQARIPKVVMGAMNPKAGCAG